MADDIKRFSKVDIEKVFEGFTAVNHGDGLKDAGNEEKNNALELHDINTPGQPGIEYATNDFNGEAR
jgi:hypothetical protein